MSENILGKKHTLSDQADELKELFENGDFRKNCSTGNLSKSSTIRGVYWRVFFGLLSEKKDLKKWISEVEVNRKRYEELSEEHYNFERKKKEKEEDLVLNNPLAISEGNIWDEFFEDEKLKKTINKDLTRLFPEHKWFKNSVLQAQLLKILFIWCKECPDWSYKQGYHDLLAAIMLILYRDSNREGEDDISESGSEYEKAIVILCNRKYIEHDSYFMIKKLLLKCRCLFGMAERDEDWNNSRRKRNMEQTAIFVVCENIQNEHLKNIDPPLHDHLTMLGIQPQVYLLKWVRLLFIRKFDLDLSILLWDCIFSLTENFKNNKDETSLDFRVVEHLCLAMINKVRDYLLQNSHVKCLEKLMNNYPEVTSVDEFIKLAVKTRANPTKPMYRAIVKKEKPKVDLEVLKPLHERSEGERRFTDWGRIKNNIPRSKFDYGKDNQQGLKPKESDYVIAETIQKQSNRAVAASNYATRQPSTQVVRNVVEKEKKSKHVRKQINKSVSKGVEGLKTGFKKIKKGLGDINIKQKTIISKGSTPKKSKTSTPKRKTQKRKNIPKSSYQKKHTNAKPSFSGYSRLKKDDQINIWRGNQYKMGKLMDNILVVMQKEVELAQTQHFDEDIVYLSLAQLKHIKDVLTGGVDFSEKTLNSLRKQNSSFLAKIEEKKRIKRDEINPKSVEKKKKRIQPSARFSVKYEGEDKKKLMYKIKPIQHASNTKITVSPEKKVRVVKKVVVDDPDDPLGAVGVNILVKEDENKLVKDIPPSDEEEESDGNVDPLTGLQIREDTPQKKPKVNEVLVEEEEKVKEELSSLSNLIEKETKIVPTETEEKAFFEQLDEKVEDVFNDSKNEINENVLQNENSLIEDNPFDEKEETEVINSESVWDDL